MHVGIFVEERRRGTSEATAFAEALELAEASEAWGLDGVWLGEIHFNPWRSVQSAPMNLAAFMAARRALAGRDAIRGRIPTCWRRVGPSTRGR